MLLVLFSLLISLKMQQKKEENGWEKYVFDSTWQSIFGKSRISGINIKKMGRSFGSFGSSGDA